LLWQAPTQSPVLAAPVTFSVDGQQYVSVAVGGGGAFGLMSGVKPPPGPGVSRILTYKLDGAATLPPLPVVDQPAPPVPRIAAADAATMVARGAGLYATHCAYCHGVGVISGGTLPDLRWLTPEKHRFFKQIVLGGLFEQGGMPRFDTLLGEDDAEAIQAYVIDKAHTDFDFLDDPRWLQRLKRAWYSVVAWFVALFIDSSAASA